jgi:hypothetical protein
MVGLLLGLVGSKDCMVLWLKAELVGFCMKFKIGWLVKAFHSLFFHSKLVGWLKLFIHYFFIQSWLVG